MRDSYERAVRHHAPELAELSPSSVLPNFDLPRWVISSSNDVVFPAGEALWTERQTEGRSNVHVLVSPWVGHGYVGRKASLPDKVRVGMFVARVLHAAATPVTLH